jgi:hypothetical protein
VTATLTGDFMMYIPVKMLMEWFEEFKARDYNKKQMQDA